MMLRPEKRSFQTYTDGWGTSCAVKDRRITGTKQEIIHFSEQTVGERRFWDAQVLGVRIVRAVLVPYDTNVDMDDIFLIGDKQYEVKQKQLYDRTRPASWMLSLSEAVINYKRKP